MAVNWAHIGDAIEKQTIQQVNQANGLRPLSVHGTVCHCKLAFCSL